MNVFEYTMEAFTPNVLLINIYDHLNYKPNFRLNDRDRKTISFVRAGSSPVYEPVINPVRLNISNLFFHSKYIGNFGCQFGIIQ